MCKRALVTASVASMIDLFNRNNIQLLQQLGYEVHVACNFEFGSITSQQRVDCFRKELEDMGIPTYQIPIPRRVGDIKNIWKSYRQMKILCDEQQFELVHTQSPIGGVVARLAARNIRKHGAKVIYTAHGFHFYKEAPMLNWMLFYPIERLLAHDTDVLITMNQEDFARAKKFHAGKVYYVPGIGVDIDKFAVCDADVNALRSEFGFSEDDFIVLSVGQLSKRKNQQTIIRAIAEIDDEHVKYLIVGLGELEEDDRRLIKTLGLENRVVLAGYRSDVNELLHMADCFAFPSLQEGLPVSLMEAMAAGVPVVCSKIRGNVDLVTDMVEGRTLLPYDKSGYARVIRELKDNLKISELYSANASKRMIQFSSAQVEEKMQMIYGQVSGGYQ